jgi:hypothetical protein
MNADDDLRRYKRAGEVVSQRAFFGRVRGIHSIAGDGGHQSPDGGGIPLRTLDAVHLTIVKGLELECVATADRIMANAARALGLDVVRFY